MFKKHEYVYAVYEEMNFTRAAEKLFISQPSLSAAVQNVEKKVGAPLFERYSGGLRLTEVGCAYIDAAKKIRGIEKEFESKLNDIYNLETGKIAVGGSNYLSSYVLPQIVTYFTSLHPQIDVTLAEAKSVSLAEMIRREEVDIVVDSFEEGMQEYEGYPLTNEKILLCVPENSMINEKLKAHAIYPEQIYNKTADIDRVLPVSIRLFRDEKFVLLKSGNDMYNRAMTIFEKGKMEPKISFSVDQLNISYALADSGMGLCFATDTFFRFGQFRKNMVLYTIEEAIAGRTLYVAHKKHKYCTRAMQEFIKAAQTVIAGKEGKRQ